MKNNINKIATVPTIYLQYISIIKQKQIFFLIYPNSKATTFNDMYYVINEFYAQKNLRQFLIITYVYVYI